MFEDLRLEPVTSPDDVEILTTINGFALEGDALKKWMELYAGSTEDESTTSALTSSLSDPDYRIVKATIQDPENGDQRLIVGFVHWLTGHIAVERTVPFSMPQGAADSGIKDAGTNENQGRSSSSTANETLDEELQRRTRRLKHGNAIYVETRNHYIHKIRSDRHSFVRRIMVNPKYQGHGVGAKLLKVVTDDADRQRIPCWLFARPAGLKLYERVGFVTVGITSMDDPEDNFVCPETHSMIRLPNKLSHQAL